MRLSLRLTLVALLTLLTWGGQVNARTVTFDPGTDVPSNNTITKDGIQVYLSSYGEFKVQNGVYYLDNAYGANRGFRFKPSEYTITSVKIYFSGTASTSAPFGVYGWGGAGGSTTYDAIENSETWTGSCTAGNDNYVGLTYSQILNISKIEVVDDGPDSGGGDAGGETTVAAPKISGSSSFEGSTEITITADEGATIYYTTNGNDPTTESTEYSAPFTITATTTVKAIAVKDGKTSSIASATFTNTSIAAPVITIDKSNPYASSTTFTITSNTTSQNVQYWYEITDPTAQEPTGSQLYTSGTYYQNPPITIASGKRVWAVARDYDSESGRWKYSGVVYADYNAESLTEKTIAELAAEGQSYEAVNVKLSNATIALAADYDESKVSGYDYSKAYSYVLREGNNVLDLVDADYQSNFYAATVSGTLTLKVDYNDGLLTASPVSGLTDYTSLQFEGSYTLSPIEVGSLAAVSDYKGDVVSLHGVTISKDNGIYTAKEGDLEVTLTGQNWVFSNVTEGEGVYDINVWYNKLWTADSKSLKLISSAIDVTPLSIELGASGYATMYYSDKQLDVPAGITATTYKLEDNGSLTATRVYSSTDDTYKTIPQYEAVVLCGTPNTTYTFTINTGSLSYQNNHSGNNLMGTDDEYDLNNNWDANNYYYYALQLAAGSDDASTIGFYWMNDDGSAFTNGAHKAYLRAAKNSTSSKGFALNGDGDATGIQSVISASASELNMNAPMYNLAGQRVGKSFKGIVIQNGKKFVVK